MLLKRSAYKLLLANLETVKPYLESSFPEESRISKFETEDLWEYALPPLEPDSGRLIDGPLVWADVEDDDRFPIQLRESLTEVEVRTPEETPKRKMCIVTMNRAPLEVREVHVFEGKLRAVL